MSLKLKRGRFVKQSVSGDHAGSRIDRFFGVPPKNEACINRPNLMDKIETAFSNRSASNIVALGGLGGMGKTQMMVQYCYLHRSAYDYVFWLKMENRAVMIESFRNLAINLGFDEANVKRGVLYENKIFQWVRCWLESKERWLLLLDDADELTIKELFAFLPRVEGDIILTTREHIPPNKATVIHVDKMEESEALLLLLGESAVESFRPENPQLVCAQEIVAALDCMPLAVYLARAYIVNEGISPQQYREMFKDPKTRNSLLSYEDEDTFEQYKYTVSTVWKLSLERLKDRKPTAFQILKACAFLNDKDIPVTLFERQHSTLELAPQLDSAVVTDQDRGLSGEAIRAFIAILVKLSFLTRSSEKVGGGTKDQANEVLTMSCLLQTVLYDEMYGEERMLWSENLAAAIDKEINFSDPFSPTTRQTMDAYLPHILHFVDIASDIGHKPLLSKDFCNLLTRTVHYIAENGPYTDTDRLGRLSISIAEVVYGADHANMATAMHNLAMLYHKQGKYDNAEMLYQRALVIREKAQEPENSNIVTSLNSLGYLYTNLGKYDKAEPLFERALEICGDVLGPEHLSTAESLNNLALLYYKQDRYDMAEPMYQKALGIRERVLGPDHPFTAASQSDLATLYDKQCKYDKAKPLHQRALGTHGKIFKSEHLNTAASLNSLAFHYYSQGEYHVAEPLFRRALTIREKILGSKHPDTAQSLNSLAAVYSSQEEYGKAEILYKQAIMIREKLLGADHPSTVTSLGNLASLYYNQGRYDKAKVLFQQVLETSQKVLGLEHPYTAAFLNNLAALSQKQGDYDQAEDLYQKALIIRKKSLGFEHPDTQKTRYRLLDIQKKQNNSCIIA